MRPTSSWFAASLVLTAVSLLGALAGCQVTTRPPPTRDDDAGPEGADAPVPPGIDAPASSTDAMMRPDRGPLPPADTDADGLSDEDEATRGTNPREADTDGDGYEDSVEVIAGTDPTDRWSYIPETDFYVVLPFEDPEIHRELDFRARLGRADIFFLVDTTGSMGAPITNVRTSLATTIVPAISDSIADAYMGVGDYRDFPVGSYGSPGDWPILVRQTMTPDVPSVQAALNLLVAGGGADGPESTTQALFVSVADPCPVPDGGFGAACFRRDSHAIIVTVTDAVFHNGPDPRWDYTGVAAARTWSDTLATLISHDIRIVGIGVGSAPIMDLRVLTEFTSSFDSTGGLTVFEAPGGAVDTAVVDGIIDLVGAENQDVSSRNSDEPSDAVDATRFITAVAPLRATRATSFDETTFYGVAGGTTVTFDVTFQNTFQPPSAIVQVYRAYIDVYDVASDIDLDRRVVYVVIPPEDGIIF